MSIPSGHPEVQVREALATVARKPGYRVCTRCVMDTTHEEIHFDEKGVCNYCLGYDDYLERREQDPERLRLQLEEKIERMREDGKGRDYDCVLGLSGGVDSSYLALKCKDWGLRPLLVQFDNGWNTELANHNIQRICEQLAFELYTKVVDWPEFRDLQVSFLRAGLANLEAPSDHGIFACIYRTAGEMGIPWLLSGVNNATEGSFPRGEKARRVFSYGYRYSDLVHLRAVHRRYGKMPLKTFPTMGFWRKLWLERKRFNRLDPLNYIAYDKRAAVSELVERLGWRPYPGKHFESVITRFHQSYVLPVKFGMDKRRLHLSGLIWSGQLTRVEGLAELQQLPCEPALLSQDYEFFIKKLRLSRSEFDGIMEAPPHTYDEFPNINWLYVGLPKFTAALRRLARRRQLQ